MYSYKYAQCAAVHTNMTIRQSKIRTSAFTIVMPILLLATLKHHLCLFKLNTNKNNQRQIYFIINGKK